MNTHMESEEYLKKQREANFQIGEQVLVIRKSYSHELGWNNLWAPPMDRCVGQIFTVMEPTNPGPGVTLNVSWGDGYYYQFPFFILKKVQVEKSASELIGKLINI